MQTQEQQTEYLFISAGAELFTLQSEAVGAYWPVIAKLLMKVKDPEWTLDEVFESIKDKKSQVWGMAIDGEIKGIWITKIMCNRETYGLVWIAAGAGIEQGLPLFLAHTESWFKELGCKYVKVVGRRGWKRMLPDYIEHAVELRKPL